MTIWTERDEVVEGVFQNLCVGANVVNVNLRFAIVGHCAAIAALYQYVALHLRGNCGAIVHR